MFKHLLLACLIGLSFNLYAGDSLTCEGKLNKKGIKHGIWACRQNERVMRREQYKNGVLKTYIIFNEKGQVIETRNRKGKIKQYKPCGC